MTAGFFLTAFAAGTLVFAAAGFDPITVSVGAGILNAGFAIAECSVVSGICFLGTLGADLIFLVRVGRFVFSGIAVVTGGGSGVAGVIRNTEIKIRDQTLSGVHTVFSGTSGPGVAFQCVEIFAAGVINDSHMAYVFFEE